MATEEIEISELEYTEELASDNLFPVESASDTKATSLQVLKNWLSSFFVGKNGDETIKGTKTLDKNPILNSSTANMVAIIDGEKKLVSDSNISTTELGYLNGVTSNLQTQVNGRANSDLSNVSSVASSFKEASVGWGMPDYSAGVTISTSQTASNYTPPANGVIIGVKTERSNDQEWFIKFGDVFLAHKFIGYFGNGFSCCVHVQKGKTYSIKGENVASFTFYPFMEG